MARTDTRPRKQLDFGRPIAHHRSGGFRQFIVASLTGLVAISVGCASEESAVAFSDDPATFSFVRVALRPDPSVETNLRQATFRLEDLLSHSGLDGAGSMMSVFEASDSGGCALEFDFTTARRFGPDGALNGLEGVRGIDSGEAVVSNRLGDDLAEGTRDLVDVPGTDFTAVVAVRLSAQASRGAVTDVCDIMIPSGSLGADLGIGATGQVWVSASDDDESTIESLMSSLDATIKKNGISADVIAVPAR